jgi:hypothetical protein
MDELDPVDPSEFVYRRIHRTFVEPGAPILIQFPAFRPSAHDTTGLSVFRARFGQPADPLVSVDPAKATDYYVAQLSVTDLHNLGLTVVPEPVAAGPRGHAVIPELSVGAYRSHKRRWKPVLVELARLASAAIVHRPGNPQSSEPLK